MRPSAAHPGLIHRAAAPALAFFLTFCAGCAFEHHRDALIQLHVQGRYEEAATVLDSSKEMYGSKNQLLWWMDRGAVALALKDDQTTIDLLEKAEDYMDTRRGPNAGESAVKWILDDTAAPFYAEPYEDIYLNVLKLLAYLESGKVQGGATVEARRAVSKSDLLRDRYLQYKTALAKQGGTGFEKAIAGDAQLASNDAGQYIDSPLGSFLTSVTFAVTGDHSNAVVVGRRLLESIRLQKGLIGPVREEDFAPLADPDTKPGNVLIVALSGRAPTLYPERIGPIPIFDWPLYFELPRMRGGSEEVRAARVFIEPGEGPASAAAASGSNPGIGEHALALVEDVAAVARENHRRELPLIYARTLLRSSIKAGISFGATQAIRHSGNRNATALASVLIGLAAITLTERADTRCWVFLPGMAHVGLFDLAPGQYRAKVEYLGEGSGTVYATPWRTLTVPENGHAPELVTIVEHYWR